MEEDGAIEGEGLVLGDTEEDGAIEGGGEGRMLGATEEDGAVEGGEEWLVLGNVVGFDVGIWEEEGVCVGIS